MNQTINDGNAALAKASESLQEGKFGDACLEIGRFLETAVAELLNDLMLGTPRNAKERIDLLLKERFLPEVLGYKMHAVRALRNVVAHSLPYTITQADVEASIATLREALVWLADDSLFACWTRITRLFEEGATQLTNSDRSPTGERDYGIVTLSRALEEAIRLKLTKFQAKRSDYRGLFEAVELLATKGVDVRHPSWRRIVDMRNMRVHPPDGEYIPDPAELDKLVAVIPDLRAILGRLSPLVP
jgi:hypothetical protein